MKMMFREALGVVRYEVKHLLRNRRTWLILAILAGIVHFYGNPVRMFCVQHGVKASLFPLFIGMTTTNTSQGVLYMLWIYLICDSPFIDKAHQYILLRCGQTNYMLGVILYLVLCSVLYWIVVFFMTLLLMVGQLEPSVNWGRVYVSLARGHVSSISLTYLTSMQKQFSATEAFALSFFLQICCSFSLALLVTGGNYTVRRMGVLLALAVLMFDKMFFWFGFPYYYMHFSPVTLANLSVLDNLAASYHPSVRYALSVVPVLSLPLMGGCVAISRKYR